MLLPLLKKKMPHYIPVFFILKISTESLIWATGNWCQARQLYSLSVVVGGESQLRVGQKVCLFHF